MSVIVQCWWASTCWGKMGAAERLIWDEGDLWVLPQPPPWALRQFICAPVPLQKQKLLYPAPRLEHQGCAIAQQNKRDSLRPQPQLSLVMTHRLSCKRFRTDATLQRVKKI